MRPRGLLRYEQEICNVISNSIRRFAPNGEQTGRLTETGLEKLSELGNMIVNNDNVDFQRYFHPIIGWFNFLTWPHRPHQTNQGWVKSTTCPSKTVQIDWSICRIINDFNLEWLSFVWSVFPILSVEMHSTLSRYYNWFFSQFYSNIIGSLGRRNFWNFLKHDVISKKILQKKIFQNIKSLSRNEKGFSTTLCYQTVEHGQDWKGKTQWIFWIS